MEGARAVRNRTLTCDSCGVTPEVLYLPDRVTGVYCEACIADAMKPREPWTPEDDKWVTEVYRKANAFLRDRPVDPHFCGTGRGRPGRRGRPRKPKVAAAPRVTVKKECKPPAVVKSWRYFSRTDRVRVTSEKPFKGIRAVVWSILLEGPSTIGEVLTRAASEGIPEKQAVAIIRKMIIVYGVLRVERARPRTGLLGDRVAEGR